MPSNSNTKSKSKSNKSLEHAEKILEKAKNNWEFLENNNDIDPFWTNQYNWCRMAKALHDAGIGIGIFNNGFQLFYLQHTKGACNFSTRDGYKLPSFK